MAPKMTADDIRRQAAELDLDEAYALREEQEDLSRRMKANKSALMNAVSLGHLDESQAAQVEELFPVRERASAAERAEKLREQLAKAEEKAAKEAAEAEPSESVDDAVSEAA